MRAVFSWLARNLGTLVVSFMLAIVVWVSAVVTADPNRQDTTAAIDIEIVGQDPNLLVVEESAHQTLLTMQAPQSIWEALNNNPELTEVWIDLTGLQAGEHTIPIQTAVHTSPVRILQLDPANVTITLEPLLRTTIPVELSLRGSLPLGYQQGMPVIDPLRVNLSGPESLVQQVMQAQISLNVAGATAPIQQTLPIQILDQDGNSVEGLTVSPREAHVDIPVSLLGGFKNVAVKVVSSGQVANGYRLTNITVSPPTVTIFSDNPNLIEQIPGYVETLPVSLDNLRDDMEIAVDLNLPSGISLVREPNVLVQVNVAAIEGTMTISAPVEVIGLEPGLGALLSPEVVDVIVSGPINELELLTAGNFRVVLDLTGLPRGIYQRTVTVDRFPEGMHVQTTLPESVEVEIATAPTVTRTVTGTPPTPAATATATPPPTATPTATSSPTPTRQMTPTPTRTERVQDD